jgi:outer membrane protein assembly factor BamB/tetratricopeptide (TPR) repeat protein
VKAFETYRRICELLPTDLGASDRMIEVFASNPEGMEQHAPSVISRGKELAELHGTLGRQNRAIQTLHRVVSLAPEDQDLRNRLIQVYLQAGLPGEAISEYDALAETALAVRDFDHAERIYRKILQIDRTRDDAQAKLNQLLSRKRMRQRGIRAAVLVGLLLSVVLFGAWHGWRWWQAHKAEEVAQAAAFGAELSTLRQKDEGLHAELEQVLAGLSAATREPQAMVVELKTGAGRRKDLLAKANEAVRGYHDLAGRHPSVAGVDGARDAAQSLEKKTAAMKTQEDRLRENVRRTLEELADELEPWPNPEFGMIELERRLKVIATLSEAVPAWQGGERGQKAQALARNVSELLGALETARTDAAELLARNDVPGAQEKLIDFLVKHLPPQDVLEQVQMPRMVRSRPLGAKILVDGQDSGLVTPAVLGLPLTRGAEIRLVDEGFQPAAIEIAPTTLVDRNRIRETLQLSIETVLHKELAFRTPPTAARIGATPVLAGERIVVPTRGIEAGVFEMSGATRPTLPTKGSGGVQVRPIVVGDVAVLAGTDRTLYAYNVTTGEAYGREMLPGVVQADPVQWNDLAIFADVEGHVTAYDVRLRCRVWTWPSTGRGRGRGFTTSPTIAGDRIVASSSDGMVYVIDPATGVEQKAGQIREGAAPIPLATGLAVTGQWYVAVSRSDRNQSRLVLADRETLKVRSSFIVDGTVRHTPLIWQGIAWVVTDDAQIEGVRIVNDTLESAQGLHLDGGVKLSAEPVLEAGVLYAGDTFGTLWAIDVTGTRPERLWDFRIPGTEKKATAITTRPLVTPSHILFGAADNAVYGLRR